jgi:hypothetical protein
MTAPDMPLDCVEFLKANRRLGYYDASQMDWLVRFVGRNLEELSKGDWLNLTYEVALYLWMNAPVGLDLAEEVPVKRERVLVPDAEAIKDCQAICRKHLYEFIATGGTSFHFQHGISMTVRKEWPTAFRLVYDTKETKGRFQVALAWTLRRAGPDLAKCPECERLFIRGRSDQKYCSSPCLSRATTRRLREKKTRVRHGSKRKLDTEKRRA